MNNTIGITLFILAAFLTSIAHILIKKNVTNYSGIEQIKSLHFQATCLLFVLVTFITICAYRYCELKSGIVLSTASYIFISIMSRLVLNEYITLKTSIGSALIIIGIVVFSQT